MSTITLLSTVDIVHWTAEKKFYGIIYYRRFRVYWNRERRRKRTMREGRWRNPRRGVSLQIKCDIVFSGIWPGSLLFLLLVCCVTICSSLNHTSTQLASMTARFVQRVEYEREWASSMTECAGVWKPVLCCEFSIASFFSLWFGDRTGACIPRNPRQHATRAFLRVLLGT